MRASILAILLALALASCTPATVSETPAPGVTLTATETEAFTAYRLDTEDPLDVVLLRFQGTGLRANAEECVQRPAALECSVGAVDEYYEVAVAGDVQNDPRNPFGVACRDTGCSAIYLSDSE